MEKQANATDLGLSSDSRRTGALICLLLGAVVSLARMFWVGRHNASLILVILFTVWVASPFVGMALVYRRSSRWPIVRQRITYNQICFISIGSAVIYLASVNLTQASRPAAPFVAVPVVSWLLMALWLWMTRYFHGEANGETTVLNLDEKQ